MTVIAAASLHKAITARWQDECDGAFKLYWQESQKTQFTTLNDEEAVAATPMPYCVYKLDPGSVVGRMSGGGTEGCANRQEIWNIPLIFNIHARQWKDVALKSAKTIAIELAGRIMASFGGHPTEVPNAIVLDTGKILIIQYQNDYGGRTGDEEYSWMVNYICQVDMPVAA